jgi:hypothetical protein
MPARDTHSYPSSPTNTRILRIDIHRSVRKIARHLHLGPGTISDCLVTPARSAARRQPAKKLDPFKTTIARLGTRLSLKGGCEAAQPIPGDSSALSPRSRLASGACGQTGLALSIMAWFRSRRDGERPDAPACLRTTRGGRLRPSRFPAGRRRVHFPRWR